MWISGKHLVLYLFDCGVHLIDTSTGGGVWETWTKHPMKHFFKCLKNPSVFSRGIFQVLKKVVQGQQHLISQGLIALGWWQKTLSKMHFDEAKSIRLRLMLFCLILMHFALCFLPSSLCNAHICTILMHNTYIYIYIRSSKTTVRVCVRVSSVCPPSKILHLTCSAYISLNYGRILMFKVSKRPYRSFRHDEIICRWRHNPPGGENLN